MPSIRTMASIAALVAAFGAGWQIKDWQCDAAWAARDARDAQAIVGATQRLDKHAATYEATRAENASQARDTQTIIRREYVNVEVPSDCAAPPVVADSLRGAVERANRAATGEPTPTMPDAPTTAGTADRPGTRYVGG